MSLVYNYSSIKLTEPMNSLLNRGLNFSILPLKLDITQILVDYMNYERRVIWQKFWFGQETDQEYMYEKPIVKTNKSNMPQNYKIPQGMQMYLHANKSELLDPQNRNQILV